MATKYTPTEAQIADLLKRTGSDPRKLAIAYLRSQNRAREAEFTLQISGDLSEALAYAVTDNEKGATAALDRAVRRGKQYAENFKR